MELFYTRIIVRCREPSIKGDYHGTRNFIVDVGNTYPDYYSIGLVFSPLKFGPCELETERFHS